MSGEGRGTPTEDPEAAEGPPGERTSTALSSARPGPGSPIDPVLLLGEAWTIFSAVWPACLVVFWGAVAAWWLIINLLVIVLASINVAIGDPAITPFLEFFRFLGLFLVPAWLWLGQSIAFLKIARRQPVAPADLFRGGPYLLTALLASGIFLAITALPCLIFYGSTEALLALGGGDPLIATVRRLLPARTPATVADFESSLLILLGLTLAILGLSYAAFFAVRIRLRPFPFLIIGRDAGVLESLRTSMQLTRRRVAPLLLVHLTQFAINLAGLLVCCVGLFVSLPLTSLISAVTYKALAVDLPTVETSDEGPEDDVT
jgi:hypothetical protein